MNFYKHFLGDYARDTGHLRLCEHGAYRALLDHYYSTAEPLPADIEALYRICRAFSDDERAAVQSVARQFFPEQPDGQRHNQRADREIAEWQEKAERSREVGKLGGRPPKTRQVSNNGQEKTYRVPTENLGITRQVSPSEGSQNPSQSQSQSQKPEPEPKYQKPEPEKQNQSQPLSGAASLTPAGTPKRSRKANSQQNGASTWEAYRAAYKQRYGVDPVRNASVNAQISRFATRLPHDEAPAVAAFYLGHNRALYCSAKHSVGLMLRDCEGLRTEWATGHRVTDGAAREADRLQTQGDVWQELIAEARERKKDGKSN